jgi:hypothetical protein
LRNNVPNRSTGSVHPLSGKRQHRFTGRLALGLDPIADAA